MTTKSRAKRKSDESKFDIAQFITDKFIALLEQGVNPWRKPWVNLGLHRNISGRPYNGLNTFWLPYIAETNGWTSPVWLTFNQLTERGGKLIGETKEERAGTFVTFWKFLPVKDKETGELTDKRRPMLRFFKVWNLDQTDLKVEAEVAPGELLSPIESAEAIILNMPNPPKMRRTGQAAYYEPRADRVTVPPLKFFSSAEEFYAALLHELAHSTGHASRLNRSGITEHAKFGSGIYSREELVAEMAQAIVLASVGIEPPMENSAAYLQSWINALKEDHRAILVAAGAASKAANYILGETAEKAVEDTEAVAEAA